MTFSQKVKEELLVHDIIASYAKFELIAAFKSVGNLIQQTNNYQIEIKTSQIKLAKRILEIIANEYPKTETQTIVRTSNKFKINKKIYIIKIQSNVINILTDLGLINKDAKFILSFNSINISDLSKKARTYYTMIFFCSSGSINDPRKSGQYHLEITNSNDKYLNEIKFICSKYDINFKMTKRKNQFSLYLNKSEEIADFLKYINAIDTLLEFEHLRMVRDMKLVNNRLNNADIANETKKISAIEKQINYINVLKKVKIYDELSDKTKQVASLRIKYPDDSMQELSQRTEGEISKSNISHHLRILKLKYESLES